MNSLNLIPESDLIEIEVIPTHTEIELKLEDAEEFNYENQFNLPKINGHELKGDKTGTELGLVNLEDYNEYKEQVNGELSQQFETLTNLNDRITQSYQELTNDIDDLSTLVGTNTQNITNLNEEIEITSSNLEALTGDVENISGELDAKQNIITDLDTIRSNATTGETFAVRGSITASTDLDGLITGCYSINNVTRADFPVSNIYGSLIQGSGNYKPQFIIGGGNGKSGVYCRRYLTGTRTWTAWQIMPAKTSELENDSNFITASVLDSYFPLKGIIGANTDLTSLTVGTYPIEGVTNPDLPATNFYGCLMQGNGRFKPQFAIGGGTGVSSLYTRRWVTSANSFTPWTSIPTKLSELQNDTNFITSDYHDTTKANVALDNISNNIDYVNLSVKYDDGKSGYRISRNKVLSQWGIGRTSTSNVGTAFDLFQPYKNQVYNIQITIKALGNYFICADVMGNQKFMVRICDSWGTPQEVDFYWKTEGYMN